MSMKTIKYSAILLIKILKKLKLQGIDVEINFQIGS
jgi:hypothetical protein